MRTSPEINPKLSKKKLKKGIILKLKCILLSFIGFVIPVKKARGFGLFVCALPLSGSFRLVFRWFVDHKSSLYWEMGGCISSIGRCLESIKTMEGSTLNIFLGIGNILLAIFMIATGIVLFVPNLISVTGVVFCSYLIIFGLLLIFFHVPASFIENYMLRNFGFMYNWLGRCLFLLFIAGMCFTLSTMGFALGICTVVLLFLNLFGMLTNDDLRNYVKNREREWETGEAEIGNDGVVRIAANKGSKSPVDPMKTQILNEWEEVIEPDSGKKYYYNPSTGETSWNAPV